MAFFIFSFFFSSFVVYYYNNKVFCLNQQKQNVRGPKTPGTLYISRQLAVEIFPATDKPHILEKKGLWEIAVLLLTREL